MSANVWHVIQHTPTATVEVATFLEEHDALFDAATRQMQCDDPDTEFYVDPALYVGAVIIVFPPQR